MVKNNEHRAETDLPPKVAEAINIAAINVASTMFVRGESSIDDLSTNVRKAVNTLKASLYSNTLEYDPEASQIAVAQAPVAQIAALPEEAPVQAKRGRKAGVSTSQSLRVEPLVKGKRGRKPKAVVIEGKVEEPIIGNEVAAEPEKKRRGRPPKVNVAAQIKAQYEAALKTVDTQEDRDQVFLAHYPAQLSIAESLEPVGPKKQMTCLIDGKPVSFLKSYLIKNYGISMSDYRRIYELPADYPDTAPAYKSKASANAKAIGLGKSVSRVKAEPGQTGEGNSSATETPVSPVRTRKTKRIDVAA